MKAPGPLTWATLGAIGSTILSFISAVVIAHYEHNFLDTQRVLSREEKRLDQKAHILDEFVSTASAFSAARKQFVKADAASNYLNAVQFGAEGNHRNKKNQPRTMQEKLQADPDLDALVKKMMDLKQELGNKVVEQQAKMLSIEAQANVYFRARVRDTLRELRPQEAHDPFIESAALEQFKHSFSPVNVPSGDFPRESMDELLGKVSDDIRRDSFALQSQAVVSAMSVELLQDTSDSARQQ